MKIQHSLLLLLFIFVVISGCREIEVTTRVNKNGSFTRIVKITGDSADVFKSDLPYPVNDSWTKEVSKDSTDSTKYILTYTKTFKNSKSLNTEIGQDTTWKKNLRRKIEIDKGFGFFYSYITFKETYFSANAFTRLNFRDYLTQDDILYLTGNKIPVTADDSIMNDRAAENVINFLQSVLATELMATLEEGIKQVNDPSLDPQQVMMFKDSIHEKLDDYYENFEVYIDFYKIWTRNEKVESLKNIEPPLFEDFNRKAALLLKVLDMEDYSQTVEMPGLLTETNSTTVSGNQVSWDVENGMFLFEDYEMMVESRVVNTWAFFVTGFILLFTIVLMILKARK